MNGSFGEFEVTTTVGRGMTVEECASLALNKLMAVSDDAPPLIRDQAMAFRENIRGLLVHYMHMAVQADRATMYHRFNSAGYPELAHLVMET